jgi:hypothetical protein
MTRSFLLGCHRGSFKDERGRMGFLGRIRTGILRAMTGRVVLACGLLGALALCSPAIAAAAAPTVTNVAPSVGPPDGGIVVHIGGTDFSGATEVHFGAVAASFVVKSATAIEAVSPEGTEGTVDVTVTTPEGTSEPVRGDHFSYVPPGPVVVEVVPDEGSSTGGKAVGIRGSDLEGAIEVTFGGTPAKSFEVLSAESIRAVTPAGGAPTVDVRVRTLEGLSPVIPGDEYHYKNGVIEITKVSPNKGPAAGGTVVQISGKEFYSVTDVMFGNASATGFTVNSPGSITATAPPQTAEKAAIRVITAYGPSEPNYCKNRGKEEPGKCAVRDYFKFEDPTVTEVSPGIGPIAGGTLVTLTGSGFALGETATEVLVGSAVATSVDCSSTTTCTAVTPAAAKAGTADVRVSIHSNEPSQSKKSSKATFVYE